MSSVLTSDEFVGGILSELVLHGISQLTLGDTLTDSNFECAYADLVRRKHELGVVPDFSIAVDRYHGDSATLRETLYAAREKGVVALNNPSFKKVEITLSPEEAKAYLDRLPIGREFFRSVVEKYFYSGEGTSEVEAAAAL
jgi:hypothetical protein